MIIENEEHLFLFSDLSYGDVFRDKNLNYLMKIKGFSRVNTVNLATGKLGFCDEDFYVYKIDGSFVVK